MDNAMWMLFRDTGDPICYLLYRAGIAAKDIDGNPDNGQTETGPQLAATD